ncbi:MAG: VanW family protein [Candidatus Shapirobacteria bacterium]|nr:VanW family protein [Candidatus Shapirobacteria bacterium]MDD3002324.1 VanW family protein [Candidatus Shapirobacteria bacterium]
MRTETNKIMNNAAQKQETPSVAVVTTPKVEPAPKPKIPTDKKEITSTKIQLPNQPGTVNAKVAAKILNRHIVKSGEIFSYNKVVGERTRDKGFIPGTMPETDANGNQIMVTEVGSGVCRVAVWTATQAKKCGLETIEITHHKYTPQYILDNPGLVDATVYWDSGTDYKFKNTKPYDILIECEVTDGCVLQGSFYQLIY